MYGVTATMKKLLKKAGDVIIKEGEESKELTDAERFFLKSEKENIWGKEARKEYKKIMKETGFTHPHYFNFEEKRNYIDRESLQDSDEVYNNFLDVMIPKTRTLFELINIVKNPAIKKIIKKTFSSNANHTMSSM